MLGIIGGSGLEHAMGGLGHSQSHDVDTPFGKPSGPIVTTEVDGVPVAMLKRHGEGHVHSPSNVPYRANVFALKKLGVTRILATGAVGSLREEIAPRSLCIPDQVIDKTFRRAGTFFDDLVVHVELASPFCPSLRGVLEQASATVPSRVHQGGTYVCMEGPQFSTRAESEMHRGWGASLIGMTVMPEARLAREAEICYALVALPTDYDCWRPHPHALDQFELLEEIIGNLKVASQNALELIRRSLSHVAALGRGLAPARRRSSSPSGPTGPPSRRPRRSGCAPSWESTSTRSRDPRGGPDPHGPAAAAGARWTLRQYPMSLSRGILVLSAVVTLLVLATPLLVWGAIPRVRVSVAGSFAAWAVLATPLIPLLSWAWAPKALEIEGGELRILRRAWRAASIQLSDVETVAVLPDRFLVGAVRTFGNGGLFGFYGWYYKKGPFRMYASRTRGLVEVVAAGKRVVVSPDEPHRFVEGLLASAPRARAVG